MSKPQYQIGMKIETVIDAVALIMAGAIFYIPGGCKNGGCKNGGYKTVPWSFLQNWSVRQLTVAVKRGTLFLAEKSTP